ncbi:MAG: DUF1674 domain-containing protein [Proteobacteria bacterium]|nr:DUF1674 domain-containing protein [Pseudomonadota bacterium]
MSKPTRPKPQSSAGNEEAGEQNAAGETKKKKTKKTLPGETEIGGPKGLEPTRYGDWESKGRAIDF